jgi:hypothetical protein
LYKRTNPVFLSSSRRAAGNRVRKRLPALAGLALATRFAYFGGEFVFDGGGEESDDGAELVEPFG